MSEVYGKVLTPRQLVQTQESLIQYHEDQKKKCTTQEDIAYHDLKIAMAEVQIKNIGR